MSGKISNIKRRDQNASSSSNSSLSSSGGGDAAMSADLASFFECPVCFDYVLPPILQCQSGHLVCSSCRSKLTCCPTCRGSLGNIRNLAMEKVCVINNNTYTYTCTRFTLLNRFMLQLSHYTQQIIAAEL